MTTTRLWTVHRFVTRCVNPVTMRFAGRAPGFGIITHIGRKTGRRYRSPVNVFRRDDSYLFVLTYGSSAQWIRNVLTTGECQLEARGVEHRLVGPELTIDPKLGPVPIFVRGIGRLVRVTECVTMHDA